MKRWIMQRLVIPFRKLIFRFADMVWLSEDTFFIIISLLIGTAAGYGSIAFRFFINELQELYLGAHGDYVSSLEFIPLYSKLVVAGAAGLTVGLLIKFFAPEAKGAGVPEVMEAVAIGGGKVRARVTIIKSICAAFTIAFGGSVGREGPIVQIGSSIGSTIGQLFGVSQARLKIMVACGAASGIAATFNAPIAGVMFAIEIILGSYALSTLTPLILSSVVATIISRMYLGTYPFIKVPVYSMVSVYEGGTYFLLGVISGVVSLFFLVLLYQTTSLFDLIPLTDYWKTCVGLGATGALLHFTPHIYGMGYQIISQALHSQVAMGTLLLLATVKIFATSLSLGGGGSGGIFAPSLFIGSLIGGAYGWLVNMIVPGVVGPSGAYALVGMGALVSGTTHGPVTAIIMLFELTGDYKIILPLMISCMVSSFVASKLKKESIYTEKLKRRGVHIDRGIEATIMSSLRCHDVCRLLQPVISPNTPYEEVIEQLFQRTHHQIYVVDTKNNYLGTIDLDTIKQFLDEKELAHIIVAYDIMEPGVTVHVNEPLTEVIRKFGIFDKEEIPVVDDAGRFIGIVTHKDIFRIYTLEILKKEHASIKFLHRGLEDQVYSDYVELPQSYEIRLFQVPRSMEGRTLRELNLRANYNVTVLAIKSAFEEQLEIKDIPDPDRKLYHHHHLLLVGPKENIVRLIGENR